MDEQSDLKPKSSKKAPWIPKAAMFVGFCVAAGGLFPALANKNFYLMASGVVVWACGAVANRIVSKNDGE